jgi:Transposase DDE domain group 1
LGRFEADVLAREENLSGLSRLNASWIERVLELTPHKRVILDLDSSVSPVHGAQEGSAYNGHFQTTCFHPLFLFNQWGDCEGATLRPGNVSSAEDWKQVLAPAVERHLARATRVLFRGDAAFAKPELYDYLEENGIEYAIRLPANDVLHARIEHLLTRPVGRPPKKPVVDYESFRYGAGTWDKERRVVAKVEWHAGELFPRVGFVVTNRQHLPSKGVIHFYNGRGTCEQWIKEGKHALNWTRLSCHRFAANRARFGLFVLAYNLANFFRRLALPKETESWSLQTIKVRLVKTGARLVRHARQLTMQIAEAAVPRRLWLGMLRRIGELRSG